MTVIVQHIVLCWNVMLAPRQYNILHYNTGRGGRCSCFARATGLLLLSLSRQCGYSFYKTSASVPNSQRDELSRCGYKNDGKRIIIYNVRVLCSLFHHHHDHAFIQHSTATPLSIGSTPLHSASLVGITGHHVNVTQPVPAACVVPPCIIIVGMVW
jgi:hypothetical protein